MPEEQNNGSVPPAPSPHTEVKDAPAPFDDRDADVILRSCDLVDFRVFKLVLSLASPVFKSMFTLPQSLSSSQSTVADDDDHRDGIPIVRLSEDARTLEDVLRSFYPVSVPCVDSMEGIARVLAVAEKYEIDTFRRRAREMLLNRVDEDPVSAYTIAVRFQIEAIVAKAAIAFLTIHHTTIMKCSSPLLSLITAEQFRRLLSFHHHAGKVASAMPFSKHWLNTLPSSMMSTIYACSRCQEKRSVTAAGGDETIVFYAPGYVWEYLTRAAFELKDWPCAGSASTASVVKGIVDSGSCYSCGRDRTGWMAVVRQSLADAINEAVAALKPSDYGMEG
ncbi:uncharacterized protein STEHIDRAFT_159481 [Stereum hirsutum FP-91666 SS1]|uniref:uncharacterized protein n=1 Tax=Stereum hirsutum (strain FP-91666) TaxID=721885 RepID=UPI000444A677|nr:uncharacterized protein STEHIDRAFT_159481 [Stereum hirsutum FP-91666 SS1]EIM83866.1 hypothetical protein STEHIDRAFT_159481 [Stereum hirsutum FP-91666 SS1]